jgi:hypothetical protein
MTASMGWRDAAATLSRDSPMQIGTALAARPVQIGTGLPARTIGESRLSAGEFDVMAARHQLRPGRFAATVTRTAR